MIWFIGFLGIVAYRVYKAGQTDFQRDPDRYRGPGIDYDVVIYIATTLGVAIAWPVVLPGYGIYRLGQKFRKEVK